MSKVDVVGDGQRSASRWLHLRDLGPSSGMDVIDLWTAEATLWYTNPELQRVSKPVRIPHR